MTAPQSASERENRRPRGRIVSAAVLLVLCVSAGCRKPDKDAVLAAPRSPREAASQIEQAFVQAQPELKQNATVASTALRSGDYEKAVVSLMTVRSSEKLTPEQGLAVHHSMVAMEGRLIRAIEAGDENAKRAYQLLKELKRN
jgi:outer membrane PBP1 activator LpoA protein